MSGFIGGSLGYRILKAIGRQDNGDAAPAYDNNSKIEVLLGKDFWKRIDRKTVVDFGCGFGDEAVEMAMHGASRVIGLDIREDVLKVGRSKAREKGVADRCTFVSETDELADVVVSIDAFEHFEDPARILAIMRRLLKSDGRVIAAFGPTWFHPLGGHLFSVFPFAHLIFTEKALIRWRADFKSDGANRFSEVAGGLNQMTISRFESIVASSDFEIDKLEAVPIRKLKVFANRVTREFTTAFVRCDLVPKN